MAQHPNSIYWRSFIHSFMFAFLLDQEVEEEEEEQQEQNGDHLITSDNHLHMFY